MFLFWEIMNNNQISLNGKWQLKDYSVGEGERYRPYLISSSQKGWMETEVPGDVHVSLLKCGRISNPYFGDNAKTLGWVNKREWWFRKEFCLPEIAKGQRCVLVFDGIDTFANIWLNGKELGKTDNMFLGYRFDVTKIIKPNRKNILTVKVKGITPVFRLFPSAKPYEPYHKSKRCYVRKSQCQFGWDWSPSLQSIGIWQGVRLEFFESGRIDNVYIRTHISGQIDFFINLDDKIIDGEIEISVKDDHRKLTNSMATSGIRHFMSIKIPKPRLWFPQGLGEEPYLYNYAVKLRRNNKVIHQMQGRFGIKEVEIYEDSFSINNLSFGIKINGVKVFCKGANWVPPDIFTGSIPVSRYGDYLEMAQKANFNMLRVWGGGIYEKDIFYDTCDELGIMVWQDFMFASSGYPLERKGFRELIKKEARYQIKRLRNHPSLTVWCGGNEKSDAFGYEPRAGEDIFNIILPGMCYDLDPQHPYVKSSPTSYNDFGNSPSSGNNHSSTWKDWWKIDINRFRETFNIPNSFNSEFCIQGPSRKRSIEKFIPPKSLWPQDKIWDFHTSTHLGVQYDNIPYHKLQHRVSEDMFGVVKGLDDYCKYGMAVHAELARAEFEYARIQKPNCGGTLCWMFNDNWPNSTWSLIDYYQLPKPAYYASRRACQPIIIVYREVKEGYQIHVCNDLLKPSSGTLYYGQFTAEGKRLWERKRKVAIGANSTGVYAEVPKEIVRDNKSSCLYAILKNKDLELKTIFYPFLWKEFPWPEPEIRYKINRQKKGRLYQAQVILNTKNLARYVHIDIEPLEKVYLSDNFFDLMPGETKSIIVCSPHRISEEDIRIGHWLTTWR